MAKKWYNAKTMTRNLNLYIRPFMGRVLFWNFILFLVIKIVLPDSAFQLASLLDSIPSFDSRQIIRLTNEARVVAGLEPLNASAKLDFAADQKLGDMAEKEYFAHTNPDGVTPWFWIKKSGYDYSVAGENLALGFYDAGDTIQAWLDSPSHRANLLNIKYSEIGVAVKEVVIENNRGILVVQMFGNPIQKPAGSVKIINPPKIITAAIQPTPTVQIQAPVQVRGQATSLPEAEMPITTENNNISTDISIATVDSPTLVKLENSKKVAGWMNILNSVFIIYLSVFALISVMALFLLKTDKEAGFKTALNFGLAILAIVIPISKSILSGLIF